MSHKGHREEFLKPRRLEMCKNDCVNRHSAS